MTSRLEKERPKQIQDKCQDLLTQMLRDEDNKYCVDCDAKGPRWASWNLGIFLCIRCAGIHRNLGVHISKVKSVNLDTWTPEQVVSLQQMGNSRARAVYEANLPDSFRRPQTDCSLESFIRAKYEHKKYIAREWVPLPLPKVNWDKELDEEAEKQRKRKKDGIKSTASQNALPPVKKPEVVPQIPKPRSSVSPKPSRSNPNAVTLDLLGLDGPTTTQTTTNGDDIFSSFLSAPPATISSTSNNIANGTTETSAISSVASKSEEESFFNQPAPTPQEKNKMTKDSILALYGTTSGHQQQTNFGLFGQPAQAKQYSPSLTNVASTFVPQNQLFPSGQNSIGQMMPSQQMNLAQSQIGSINQMHAPMISQMSQNNVANSSWSGMLTQNIQPAPGSNPFFNLATQSTNFTSQLSQQMTQMSLNGLANNPTSGPLSGQTLSTNLWQ